jgi:hypothetical protein
MPAGWNILRARAFGLRPGCSLTGGALRKIPRFRETFSSVASQDAARTIVR